MAECLRCDAEVAPDSVFCDACAEAVAADVAGGRADEPGEVRRAHLRTSVDYLQRRLNFVNDKANVFIAIQTGLFVTIVWLLGTFFLPGGSADGSVEAAGVLLFLVVNFAFVVGVVALLLQTVRPSETYLSRYTGIDTVDTAGVMWPAGDGPAPEAFVDRVASLDPDDVERELAGTVYALQQLVDRTYAFYRWAVLLMKVQIIVVPTGFLALAVATFV